MHGHSQGLLHFSWITRILFLQSLSRLLSSNIYPFTLIMATESFPPTHTHLSTALINPDPPTPPLCQPRAGPEGTAGLVPPRHPRHSAPRDAPPPTTRRLPLHQRSLTTRRCTENMCLLLLSVLWHWSPETGQCCRGRYLQLRTMSVFMRILGAGIQTVRI
jgi:hypothetical protein